MSGVTVEDFQAIQAEIIKLKTANYELKEQIESAKRKSSMSGPQYAEELKNSNFQNRIRINQMIKERDELLEKLKLVRIIQFLQTQNLYEATSIPDIQTIPQNIRPIATEVITLMEDVKQQIAKRSFLDTQVNELNKKTKTLGRVCEQLQQQITELRDKQKVELSAVEERRSELAKLEAEASKLRESLTAASVPKQSQLTQSDLKIIKKRARTVEADLKRRQEEHSAVVDSLRARIEEHNRRLADSQETKAVIERKMQQKIEAFQQEINKRRGVVVRGGGGRNDSARLFIESKELIEELARKQERAWELEERVAFSRNAVAKMAAELLKVRLGRSAAAPRAFPGYERARDGIVRVAHLERLIAERKKKT